MRTGQYTIETGSIHYWFDLAWPGREYDFDEIEQWCVEQFGILGAWYIGSRNRIYFYREEDMLVFLLRWA